MTYQQYLKTPANIKVALGFADGPIHIAINVKTEEAEMCPEARYSTKLGWYIPSGTPLPKLHARFIPLTYRT